VLRLQGMLLDWETYRTVRRQATSEDTPARIKTSLPKPEPVPTSPPMIVIESKAAMATRGIACRVSVSGPSLIASSQWCVITLSSNCACPGPEYCSKPLEQWVINWCSRQKQRPWPASRQRCLACSASQGSASHVPASSHRHQYAHQMGIVNMEIRDIHDRHASNI
jgi:hypothetical protein